MRYGSFFIPMDEALGFCAADISGRPFLVFEASFPEERIGAFDTCMCEEFFRAFAVNSGITLHLRVPYGSNSHHMTEALFKAFAHALKIAVRKECHGRNALDEKESSDDNFFRLLILKRQLRQTLQGRYEHRRKGCRRLSFRSEFVYSCGANGYIWSILTERSRAKRLIRTFYNGSRKNGASC